MLLKLFFVVVTCSKFQVSKWLAWHTWWEIINHHLWNPSLDVYLSHHEHFSWFLAMFIEDRFKDEPTDVHLAPARWVSHRTFRVIWQTFCKDATHPFFWEIAPKHLENVEVSVWKHQWSWRQESVADSASRHVMGHFVGLHLSHVFVPTHSYLEVKCHVYQGINWTLQSGTSFHHEHGIAFRKASTLFEIGFIELHFPSFTVLSLKVIH